MVFRKHLINPIKELAENGKLTGIMLITATFLSLILSNSDYGISYLKIWNTEIGFSFLHKSILHWINDGFMAVFFLLPGVALWYFILKSGIHPTVAGVLLAFTIPLNLIVDFEHRLNKPVNYLILPLFALANTAMPVSFGQTANLIAPLSLGIICGLFIGKSAGIFLASFIAVKSKFASLPADINWKQILGLGMTAGIGFTMSIFIASLSFESDSALTLAKLAILAGSFLSAVAGIAILRYTSVR